MAKRLLATLVCTLMVLAMLAGCASTTAPAGTDTPASVAPDVSASAGAPAEVAKKELTINWGADIPDPSGDDFGKWLQEHFKVKIVPVSSDAEKVKMMASSDSLPDLIGGIALGDPTFNQLRADEMIRDIPTDLLSKYPLLKKSIDEHPYLATFKVSLGKDYWLPKYGNVDKYQPAYLMPFYYRADWLKKLNLAVPKTVDEYYNVLKAFKEQDPDGNGQNDTYGITGWLWQVHFLPWADMYAWEKQADGKWVPSFTTNKMLDGLKFYNKLYQEKILDPEFASADAMSMFVTDKVGVLCANSSAWHVWNNIYKKFTGTKHGEVQYTVDEAMAAVQFLPPLAADANSPQQWSPSIDPYGFCFSYKASDEIVDRVLEIADWQLSPDGRDFMTYGFKDKDWIVKDGKAVSILPNNPSTGTQKKLWEVYPSCNDGITPSMGYDNPGTPALNPTLPQECIDRQNEWQTMATPFLIKENFAINNLTTPAKDKCAIAPAGACEPDFQNLVASSNIDADWATLIKSYMDTQGLAAAIDEVNAAIIAQGLDK